jgi:hypothetical protein
MAMAAASTAASVMGAQQQAKNQEAVAKHNAAQAQADANAEQSAAEVHADKIRKAGRIKASEATAQLAGSGVDVGEGSAVRINEDITAGAEEDAVMTVFGGKDRAARLNSQAAMDKWSASNYSKAGTINAASSVLSGASSMLRGYKTAGEPANKTGA